MIIAVVIVMIIIAITSSLLLCINIISGRNLKRRLTALGRQILSYYRSCAHGQSPLCLQLRADEAKGSIQWKMTLKPRLCVKTAGNSNKSYLLTDTNAVPPIGQRGAVWDCSMG